MTEKLMQPLSFDKSTASVRELSFRGFCLLTAATLILTWAVVWVYIARFPMAYEGRDYPVALAKKALIEQCRSNQIVIFGDSRVVAGVLPTAMDMPVENLALPGASPVETYFLAKRVLRCPTPPRLVVIAHSASMYPKDEFFWSLFAALGILSTNDILSVEANARKLGDNELRYAQRPSAIPYFSLPALYAIHFPPLYFGVLLGGYGAARWRYNQRAYDETMSTSGRSSFGTADGSDAISDETKMDNWHVSPLVDLYLRRTLSLLATHNVPVVMMTMPINASTCENLPSVIRLRFSEYFQKLSQSNANIELSEPKISCWPDKYYGDAWHFNKSGAVRFSRNLQSVLSTLFILKREEAKQTHTQNLVAPLAYSNKDPVSEMDIGNE